MTATDTSTAGVTWPSGVDTVVDCDAHVLEPADLWERYIDPQYRERAIRVVEIDGVESLVVDGQTVMSGNLAGLGGAHLDRATLLGGGLRYIDGCPPASYDPAARRAWTTAWGLRASLVFPTIGILPFPTEDDGLLNAYSTAYNRWMTDFASEVGDGMVLPVAHLNLRDVEGAVEELDRCIERGFKAVFLPPEPVADRLLSDGHLDPVWRRCAEAGLPVCLHVVVRFGGAARPFGPWLDAGAGMLFGFTLGAPGQLIPALTNMVFGGVFERVPDLKLLAVEAGAGWAPYLMDRMHEKVDTLGALVPPMELTPAEQVQRNCWFVAEPAERTIGTCLDVVGEDRILWGSDFPHIDATLQAPHLVKASVSSLSLDRQRAVLGANAAKLFGIA